MGGGEAAGRTRTKRTGFDTTELLGVYVDVGVGRVPDWHEQDLRDREDIPCFVGGGRRRESDTQLPRASLFPSRACGGANPAPRVRRVEELKE